MQNKQTLYSSFAYSYTRYGKKMKPISYYKTSSVSIPVKDYYLTTYYYKEGRLVVIRKGGYLNEDFEAPSGCVEENVLDQISYEEHRKLYNQEVINLQQEFKMDLLQKYYSTNHPKAIDCFNLAWEFASGHFEEVEYYFEGISKLVILDDVLGNPIQDEIKFNFKS
jgi:hypothetical protein